MLDFEHIRHKSLRMALQGIVNALLFGVWGGGDLGVGGTATKFKLGATDYRIAGTAYTKAAADNIASPASTSAGQYRKDLISLDAAGTVTVTAGAVAVSQDAAVLPACPADNVPVGWIEVPASFTSGTTEVTAGMLRKWTHAIDLLAEVA